uniref:RNase H type-1 domain-containing protein n=1 Tax=Oryza punctata TaxID=4537 RepID=A0A0E0MDX6_ORYPU
MSLKCLIKHREEYWIAILQSLASERVMTARLHVSFLVRILSTQKQLGFLSGLQLARKLKIRKIDVVTDNMEIYEVLIGRKDVFQHKHRDVLLMAIEIAKEFNVCRFRWEPRELLGLVNEMANATREGYQTKALSLRRIWKDRAYCLWGLLLQVHEIHVQVSRRALGSDDLSLPVSIELTAIIPQC